MKTESKEIPKMHIAKFLETCSDYDLMKAVEAFLEWQSGGIGVKVVETDKKEKRTPIDDIYDLYIEPLEGPGVSSWLSAYSLITHEIAKRAYIKTFQHG
jgi:hypothetical protein